MNIIDKMKELIAGCSLISTIADELHIDYTDGEPAGFGLAPLGDTLIGKDVTGCGMRRQHTFMFYSIFSAINDYERLANSGVLIDLSIWLENQGGTFEQAVGSETYSGEITRITTANGRLYDVPLDSGAFGYRYQLQIIVEYTLEEE